MVVGQWSTERRGDGWYVSPTSPSRYDKPKQRGPFDTIETACLSIARSLAVELARISQAQSSASPLPPETDDASQEERQESGHLTLHLVPRNRSRGTFLCRAFVSARPPRVAIFRVQIKLPILQAPVCLQAT